MTTKTEQYKWIDVTDELEQRVVPIVLIASYGTQYVHHERIIFTLVETPVRTRRLVPGRPLRDGEYRVMVDYLSDTENGIGAVWQKVPCVEEVDKREQNEQRKEVSRMGDWKEVARIDSRCSSDNRLRTRHVSVPGGKSYTAVEVYERGEVDVMDKCTVELRQSRHSNGYYCNIMHNGKSIVALGVDNASKCIVKPRYRMVKAKGATISFRIVKDNK